MGDGSMTEERTVWCAWCDEWLQLSQVSKRGTWHRTFVSYGWVKAAGVWMCPVCVKTRNESEADDEQRD